VEVFLGSEVPVESDDVYEDAMFISSSISFTFCCGMSMFGNIHI
jgi:hypothetical protein